MGGRRWRGGPASAAVESHAGCCVSVEFKWNLEPSGRRLPAPPSHSASAEPRLSEGQTLSAFPVLIY